MLSLLVFFPLCFGLLLFLFPQRLLTAGALAGSVIQFLLSGSLYFFFDPSSPHLQLAEGFELIPYFWRELFSGFGRSLLLVCCVVWFSAPSGGVVFSQSKEPSLLFSLVQHCHSKQRGVFKL